MRLIEAVFPNSKRDQVEKAVEDHKPTHARFSTTEEDDSSVLRALFVEEGAQGLVDALQSICGHEKNWRIIVLPVEATAPKPEDKEETDREKNGARKNVALREEIYEDVADGAELSIDFFLLTFASSIVAALGLNADNIAAVIGAMVIAPLLGPILAISLGAALGDMKLLMRAGRNATAGLAVGFTTAALIGLLVGANMESGELMSRTVAGLDSVVLALAAGVAAALSIVAGISAALVGVMVAVALLPPAAAAGLFFGAGDFGDFGHSLLLLMINVTCIMLAAQAIYIFKGVRPRTWFEKQAAARASKINMISLLALLAVLVAVVLFAPSGSVPGVPVLAD
ncbi:TIGR00341 family protein [Hyphococcus luteus]|uniref:TIGR00341 family protein n=1 Tax=Hyphococcus luteus TaxID=2058213 RepID=A0A2S7K8E4_9PROT|nr:TIGR00341 family protein [Marinicaulis flavus]PQA88761.1 TIGR00341 family protein [Marinicaulis flavus]